MSTTVQPKQSKQDKPKQTLVAKIGAVLVQLDEAIEKGKQAKQAAGFLRVRLGALFALKLQQEADKGVTGEAAQTVIMNLLKGHRDENDEDYSWDTVDAWIRAARVEESLPQDLREVFNSDGLLVIGRVEKKKDLDTDDMVKFAKQAKQKGATSVRGVRNLYKATFPAAPRAEKSDAAIADGIVGEYSDVAKAMRKSLAKNGVLWNVIRPVAIFAATVGASEPKNPEAVLIALNVLMDPKQDQPKQAKQKAAKK